MLAAQDQTCSDSAFTPQVALPGPTDGRGADRPEGNTRGAVTGLLRLSKAGIRQQRKKVGRDVLRLKSWAYGPATLEAKRRELELRTFPPGRGTPEQTRGSAPPLLSWDGVTSTTLEPIRSGTPFVEDP